MVGGRRVFVITNPRNGSSAKPLVTEALRAGGTRMLWSEKASFSYYAFNFTVPFQTGFSSFHVEVSDESGKTTVHSNGGGGYPLGDGIVARQELWCHDLGVVDPGGEGPAPLNFSLEVAAVVRNPLQNALSSYPLLIFCIQGPRGHGLR
jgi:hypothetical protein